MDRDLGSHFQGAQHPLRHAIPGVAFIQRNPRMIRPQLNADAASRFHPHLVMQADGLINRAQLVKAILAQRPNA